MNVLMVENDTLSRELTLDVLKDSLKRVFMIIYQKL